jgi:hypothetical protein
VNIVEIRVILVSQKGLALKVTKQKGQQWKKQ